MVGSWKWAGPHGTWHAREAFFFFNVLFYLFICHVTYGILVPQPGIEPNPPALGAWSLDHWSSRGVPREALECCHVYGTDPATEKAHQRCAE